MNIFKDLNYCDLSNKLECIPLVLIRVLVIIVFCLNSENSISQLSIPRFVDTIIFQNKQDSKRIIYENGMGDRIDYSFDSSGVLIASNSCEMRHQYIGDGYDTSIIVLHIDSTIYRNDSTYLHQFKYQIEENKSGVDMVLVDEYEYVSSSSRGKYRIKTNKDSMVWGTGIIETTNISTLNNTLLKENGVYTDYYFRYEINDKERLDHWIIKSHKNNTYFIDTSHCGYEGIEFRTMEIEYTRSNKPSQFSVFNSYTIMDKKFNDFHGILKRKYLKKPVILFKIYCDPKKRIIEYDPIGPSIIRRFKKYHLGETLF